MFEKFGVIASIEDWQTARAARNLAAHDYGTDYQLVAEHFNTLHELRPTLYAAAGRFLAYCTDQLAITPASQDFAADFARTTAQVS